MTRSRPRCLISGKIPYPSEQDADAVLTRIWSRPRTGRHLETRAYACHWCGGWHLTKKASDDWKECTPVEQIPAWAHQTCEKCQQTVAYVQTPKTSKGQPVEIPVDLTPTSVGLVAVAEVQRGRRTYLKGGPVTPGQARGMRAANIPLYSQHNCNKPRGRK